MQKLYIRKGSGHQETEHCDAGCQAVYLASDVNEAAKVLRELTAELPEKIPDGMPPLAYWMALATAQRQIARKALSLMER